MSITQVLRGTRAINPYGDGMRFLHQSTEPASEPLKVRGEVRPEDTWDLSALYQSEDAWEEEFQAVQSEFPSIRNYLGRLHEGPAIVLEAFQLEESVDRRIERLMQYAGLRSSEDSSDAAALEREARLESVLVRIGEAFSFVAPELQALEDAAFDCLLADDRLDNWRVTLGKLRRLKPHTLSAGEERLLALGASVSGGHSETFSQLTNVDMDYGKVADSEGREVRVTQGSLSSLLQKPDPRVRRDAFHSFYAEISAHRYTLASSLASSMRGDVFRARARHYGSALEAALFPDDVPSSVYENLIDCVHRRLPVLYRYFELRRRCLGLEEIHHYDTYVPMVPDLHVQTSWDGAVDMVLEALHPLGADYLGVLGRGLREERWCDRYENKGKRSGAFSYGTYTGHPYILMNYKEDVFSDIYTLAHEAGHSMHSWYSRQAQPFQNYHYTIFLAEVASTFNEILLTDHLLNQTDDQKMRAYLINREIDDLRGTLFRQTMFAEFEMLAHQSEESGEGLTLDRFRSIYRGLLDLYFGPDFRIDGELELECLRIPHFYSAFYVYKYATGIAAAAALARQVLTTGDASKYFGFLRSGGSRFPIETLQAAGVDMLGREPVDAALDLFEQRVSELETLLQ